MNQIKEIPRVNNFDIIRLLAAFQVVYMHSMNHLKIEGSVAVFYERFLQYFPGVPIFFTVSGFLIFWAYDRNPDLKKYIVNRLLRLYPALYVCLAITIGLLVTFSSISLLSNTSFYVWLVGQVSIFQFYTPEILRFWGVGTPNGALWTIAVEVQFYIVVPLFFLLMRKVRGSVLLTILFIISVLANFYLAGLPQTTIQKLSFVSIIPYLFNFLIGSVFYIYWDKLNFLVKNKFWRWLIVYALYIVILGHVMGHELHAYQLINFYQFLATILLSIFTLSFAFSFNSLSDKLLRHNDISYGIYIYHMLVVNTFVSLGLIADSKYFLATFITTIVLAFLSWKLIEKPALSLKKRF